MIEEWKHIEGYPNYKVSNIGNVLRISTGKLLTKHIHRQGYVKFRLYKDGVQKSFYAHRLVAAAFIPKVEGKEFINHIDADKKNNAITNLEWCTFSENQIHAYSVIGKAMPTGSNHHKASPVICLNTGREFQTIQEAVKELNLSHGNIVKVCQGERKHTGGYQFKYAS